MDTTVQTREEHRKPIYTIGVTARFLNVCIRTLRIWEKNGLINPSRLGKDRFYSNHDIDRLKYIKKLLREKRINIQGVKNILSIKPCWEIIQCKPKDRDACPVYKQRSLSPLFIAS